MDESEERREEQPRERDAAPEGQPSEQRSFSGPGNAGASGGGNGPAGGNDFRDRARRRGRRGRGGGAPRFAGPARGPMAPRGPIPPRSPMPPRDDEESSQARELAAYERRQQQQRNRPFRGPGWVAGSRPIGSGPAPFRAPMGASGGFRPAGRPMGGGMRGPRRPGGGAAYTEQIRRVTAGPRAQAAPSHEAGEPIAGPHAVLEAIRAGRVVKRLFVSNERGTRTGPVNDLITEAQQRRIFVRFVDPMEVQRLSPVENHQGVVAIVEGKAGVELEELLLHLDTLPEPALVLVIDSLQDPQNFGVLLRSAEGTGVDGVVIPRHRSVGLTPAVAKTSSGASEHLMIADVANLRQAIDALKEKGVWVVATDETGDLLYDEVDYRGATAIVIGGEAEGIRRLVLEGCDQVVRIPMEGQVTSLNAAAAGTVVLYEALRQRRRNVAPADTRTPPPVRAQPTTPPEQDMTDAADAEGDEDEVEVVADDGEALPIDTDAEDETASAGEEAASPAGGGARSAEEPRDDDADDADDEADAGEPEPAAVAEAPSPKKRATRAARPVKKTTTTRKTTRKKSTD